MSTPDPTYEGRRLPRPDDEVVDQGLAFDLGTLVTRRRALAAGGGPMVGAAVCAWHCDREGRYSVSSAGVESENYLRGVQVTDADGVVRFTSVFPARYAGRWPHVHVEVDPDESSITDASQAIATSQLTFPQSVYDTVYATTGYEQSVANLGQLSLTTDGVFGDDGGAHQPQLAVMPGRAVSRQPRAGV